ncbi:hypothetical protein B5P24_03815 [Clavibacter tessellarius]|uniref:Uncharacterized protein n=2 Tax=Clavibacter tessellarius TaxID=31965 RepID=A0A225C6L0_9MICO|nr:hypothetical protein B5P24_03815 [Clavibacter michiganensis subsp. tessellarius]
MLAASRPGATSLRVEYGGEAVLDPYLVELELWSTGRADIPSSRFDAGRSLEFDIGAPIIELTSVAGIASEQLEGIEDSSVRVGPMLISRKFRLKVDLVTSSPPNVRLSAQPLIDVTVSGIDRRAMEQRIQKPSRRGWVLLTLASMAVAVLGLVAIIAAGLMYPTDTKSPGFLGIGVPGVLALFGGLGTAVITLLVTGIRWVVFQLKDR